MGIKIGIDPSGTGTIAIIGYENKKIIKKLEFTNKDWKEHYKFINIKIGTPIPFINVEDCLPTSANGSKDRDDLLRLLGSLHVLNSIIWVSPRHTKSVVKNMENLSKYNNGCIQEFNKDV